MVLCIFVNPLSCLLIVLINKCQVSAILWCFSTHAAMHVMCSLAVEPKPYIRQLTWTCWHAWELLFTVQPQVSLLCHCVSLSHSIMFIPCMHMLHTTVPSRGGGGGGRGARHDRITWTSMEKRTQNCTVEVSWLKVLAAISYFWACAASW